MAAAGSYAVGGLQFGRLNTHRGLYDDVLGEPQRSSIDSHTTVPSPSPLHASPSTIVPPKNKIVLARLADYKYGLKKTIYDRAKLRIVTKGPMQLYSCKTCKRTIISALRMYLTIDLLLFGCFYAVLPILGCVQPLSGTFSDIS